MTTITFDDSDEIMKEGMVIAREILREEPSLDIDGLFAKTLVLLSEIYLWPIQKRADQLREKIKKEMFGSDYHTEFN